MRRWRSHALTAAVCAIAFSFAASAAGEAPQGSRHRRKGPKVRPKIVVIAPPESIPEGSGPGVEKDASVLVHLVLTSTLAVDVRPSPDRSEGKDLFRLPLRIGQPSSRGRMAEAVDSTRDTLSGLPKYLRRPALKRLKRLSLEKFDAAQGGIFLDALQARMVGDPSSAASLLREVRGSGVPPIAAYELATALIESGDLEGAAGVHAGVEGSGGWLPPPMRAVLRAATAAAAERASGARQDLDRAVDAAPSLAEARWLRARLSRTDCSLYDRDRIEADLVAAVRSMPCCAACALDLAEMAAFTGRPEQTASLLLRDHGCAVGPLDSVRERGTALALAASGRPAEALEAAARAEARDASPLRSGLAPAFILAGDHARLSESYDSEADVRLAPEISAEEHLYSGLNALWTGNPSAAAQQFERAEEHVRKVAGRSKSGEPPPLLDLLRSLRIRAYLTAGRAAEASRLVAGLRSERGERVEGLLAYTAAQADIASAGPDAALEFSRRLSSAVEKFWRYLIVAEASLAKGRAEEASSQISLALQGVNTQVTICPGIPMEPFVYDVQARVLLALGRPAEATRFLDRLLGLGARAVFAPDVVVRAWALVGRAREGAGDRAGAAAAYQEILRRWQGGEEPPAVEEARAALRALGARPQAEDRK